MPPLKPATGVARLVFKGSIASVNTVNVFHIDKAQYSDQAWTQGELDGVIAGARASYVARFVPLITSSWGLTECTLQDLTTDTGLVAVNTTAATGGKAGSTGTSNVAQCITWKIARHYRGGHPRTYLPPPATGDITGFNTWQGTHRTALQAAADGFLADVNGIVSSAGNLRLTALHRYRGWTLDTVRGVKIPTQLPVPLKSYITAAAVDTRVDSMRRRLGRDR